MEQIQFTKGCPNNCSYCYEPKHLEFLDPNIPEDEDLIQILDMNLLANPKAEEHIVNCMESNNKHFELICGVDYRLLDQNMACMLHNARFIKIRWAWDYNFGQQKTHQKVWRMFLKAGYRAEDISVFILTNWKIPFDDCIKKLDLLKVWGVKVNDCCFDGGYNLAKPLFWTPEQIKNFRRICRKHNQMIRFKIDPEYK